MITPYDLFLQFVEYSKYFSLFILYIFTFFFLFFQNTTYISFFLFFILQIIFLILFFYDYDIITANLAAKWQFILLGLAGGSWLFLSIGLIVLIALFQKFKYYKRKNNEPVHLGKNQKNELNILKILSIVIATSLAFIYIFLRFSGLTTLVNRFFQMKNTNTNKKIAYFFLAILFFTSIFIYLKMIKMTDFATISMFVAMFLAIIYIIYYDLSDKQFYLFSLTAVSIRSILLIFSVILYFFIFKDTNMLFAIVPLLMSIIFGLFVSFNETGKFQPNSDDLIKKIVFPGFVLLFILSLVYLIYSIFFFRKFSIISKS